MDDSAQARREAAATIRRSREAGARFCLLHHTSAEQLVNKNRHEITRLGDYTDMIRQEGMIPGLSAHMPELITYVGLNFSWHTIRDCDMVTVGCSYPHEAEEDIEISLAAFEHRYPDIGKRASPNMHQDAFGGGGKKHV